jgi:hypothetical protein
VGVIEDIEGIRPESLRQVLLILLSLPLIALIGFAAVTARTTLSVCTALGLGPWLAAMWRSRRRLADASAVQLTRNPTALARAVRTLEANDVEVPGGWVAYFLFPIWVPISDTNASQGEAASHIVGMRLETDPRIESIVALGAMLGTDVRQPGWRTRLSRLGTWKDMRTFAGWGVVAIVLCAVLIAVTLAVASLVLLAFWHAGRLLNPLR